MNGATILKNMQRKTTTFQIFSFTAPHDATNTTKQVAQKTQASIVQNKERKDLMAKKYRSYVIYNRNISLLSSNRQLFSNRSYKRNSKSISTSKSLPLSPFHGKKVSSTVTLSSQHLHSQIFLFLKRPPLGKYAST